jgi:hypothetical protein
VAAEVGAVITAVEEVLVAQSMQRGLRSQQVHTLSQWAQVVQVGHQEEVLGLTLPLRSTELHILAKAVELAHPIIILGLVETAAVEAAARPTAAVLDLKEGMEVQVEAGVAEPAVVVWAEMEVQQMAGQVLLLWHRVV